MRDGVRRAEGVRGRRGPPGQPHLLGPQDPNP